MSIKRAGSETPRNGRSSKRPPRLPQTPVGRAQRRVSGSLPRRVVSTLIFVVVRERCRPATYGTVIASGSRNESQPAKEGTTMVLLLEIILTVTAWRKGWRARALLPLGVT